MEGKSVCGRDGAFFLVAPDCGSELSLEDARAMVWTVSSASDDFLPF
jgi:hypothetical protein